MGPPALCRTACRRRGRWFEATLVRELEAVTKILLVVLVNIMVKVSGTKRMAVGQARGTKRVPPLKVTLKLSAYYLQVNH